jgi:hypothetical protein
MYTKKSKLPKNVFKKTKLLTKNMLVLVIINSKVNLMHRCKCIADSYFLNNNNA